MRGFFVMVIVLAVVALMGCASHPVSKGGSGAFVRGRARVVDVQPELGLVMLEMDGQQVRAFWQTEQTAVSGGQNSMGQPEVRVNNFPGKAGDTVDFVGVRSGNEIMLGRVAVVSP